MQLPIDQVSRDYRKYIQYDEIKGIVEHYNIYKDLYDCGYFYPVKNFGVKYAIGDGKTSQYVHYGNKLDASQVRIAF